MLVTKKQTILADVRRADLRRRPVVVRTGLTLVRVGGGGGDTIEIFDVTSTTPPIWWPTKFAWPPADAAPASWKAEAKWPPTTSVELAAGGGSVVENKDAPLEEHAAPAPAWWPSSFAWPPTLTPPPTWLAGAKWPPMSAVELSAGVTASMTSAGPPAHAEAAKTGMTPGQKDAVAVGAGALIGGVVAKLVIGAGAVTVGPIALGAVLGAMFGHAFFAMATGNPLTSVATKGCGCGGPPSKAEYPLLIE
jgi:hypothetical protein